MDREAVRAAALIAAASAVQRGTSSPNVTAYADQLIPWLTALATDHLDATVTVDGRAAGHSSNGGTMAFTATPGVNQKFDVTVLPKDSGENTTADGISFATDDPGGAVLTPSLSADGRTWTGTLTGQLGTVNVTATSVQVPSVPPYTAQLIVQAGQTTHLVGTVTVT
jgi:hypothetical protein